jgi:uncharacterized protein (TIGR00369 family)
MDDTKPKPTTRTRATSWTDPHAAPRVENTMDGRQALEATISGEAPLPPIAATLGYHISEVGDGMAVVSCDPGEHHLNPFQIIHGGLAAALIDTATGCAISSQSPAGVGQTTINLQVEYFRAMTENTGRVRCEGRVVKRGRRIAVADAEIKGEDGTIYARGSGTYMIIEP